MKKTLSIDLGDRPFVIDEDAYDMLDNYLKQIGMRQVTADEIADIERRLADMFSETGLAIIHIDTVRNAMVQIGPPDSFGIPKPEPTVHQKQPKRLYRSRKDRVIGGVCGGLAEYFGVDPLVIRLAFLLLLFFGGGLILYIIFWIIVPQRPVTFMDGGIETRDR